MTILEALPDFLSVADADVAKEAASVQEARAGHPARRDDRGSQGVEAGVSVAYTDKASVAQHLDADRLIVSAGCAEH